MSKGKGVVYYMRWLINYIRSCFCEHEWETVIENVPAYENGDSKRPFKRIWVYRCNKCGYKNQITIKS